MKTEYRNRKRYYSIKEVSQMTGLRSYVLRYWETVFPKLKPLKHSVNGRRMYTEKDIEIVKRIKELLYEKKYTIKGANEVMNSKVEIVQLNFDFKNDKNYIKGEIKRKLNEVVNLLKGEK
ncbi:MAG: MerR family transcriptional regulator [bacterium]|uniref:MerR family transcriptional regulator n=2 Tax=Bacteria candidate phyla TaxID=1783234 RepID=A0A101I458_UNCT6|nr:MAG: MerR family transcriptional regulator [candidate division TA06 bacterium 32_111]KUK88094.1 MAG: MerR family transcriptional regulator [candidate division TA06 bacterium 34_109]MDI6700895.1 MerR family transcriptional regulator [bacterium]HAF07024.1 MerR family transcriptional regulator [candidate division WOR-3 bacterium]HCP16938.1 MerR family transcriptional regulator [candidate division WOR-3 bacterium]